MSLWTPAEIATDLWLDAADAATISLSGSAVTQWNDKSGGNKHCTQGVAASRPTYDAVGFNGKGSLSFDGNDFLGASIAVTGGAYGGHFNIFYVAARTTAAGGTIFTERNTTRVASSMWTKFSGVNYLSSDGFSSGSNHQIGNADYDQLSVGGGIVSHFHAPSVRNTLWLNGSPITVTTGTASFISGNTGYRVGRRDDAQTQYFTGKIMEIIILARSTTVDERQLTEGYLAHKWGLAGNLPSDHPYKNIGSVLGSQTRRRQQLGGFGL